MKTESQKAENHLPRALPTRHSTQLAHQHVEREAMRKLRSSGVLRPPPTWSPQQLSRQNSGRRSRSNDSCNCPSLHVVRKKKKKGKVSSLQTLACTAPRHLKGKSSCCCFSHQEPGHSRVSLSTICERLGELRERDWCLRENSWNSWWRMKNT